MRRVAYGVDFAEQAAGWRILHMTLFEDPQAATPPVRYCHLNETVTY
jgi:hypothetical protein